MRIVKISAVITLAAITLSLGAFEFPRTVQAEGPLSTGGCAFGQCGVGGGLPTTGSTGGVQMPNNPVTSAVSGGGTRANTGVTDGGNVIGDRVYVTGINRRVIESLRRPNISTAESAARETSQSLYEWFQSFVREALKKRLLDMMVAEIVQWIQNGDEPRFVVDWESYLEDAGQAAAGDFAQRIGAGILCEPFSAQIELNLAPRTANQNGSGFDEFECTLDDIVGNINAFYEDFSAGGWIAYQEAWEPKNNIFGSFLLTKSAQRRAAESARIAAQSDALSGGGFISPKSCSEAIGGTGPDLDKDGIKGDIAESCGITTPGSVVEELTKKAITADIDFVINADQLSTYLSAIADAAFNRIIRDGVNGLRGLTTDDAPEGGFIPEDENGCQAFPLSSPLRAACEGYEDSNGDNFEATQNDILADLDATRSQYLLARAFASSSINVSADLVTYLKGEPSRCTEQANIDDIEAAIVELTDNVTALNIIIGEIDESKQLILAVPLNDWVALTETMQTVENNINIAAATEIAEAASLRYDNIVTEGELIRQNVRECAP